MAKKTEAEAIRGFLDDLWKQAQGMLSKGRVRTEKAAHVAKTKMDIYLLGRKKDDLFRELGELFHASSKRKKPSGKKQQRLLAVLAEIRELEVQEKILRKGVRSASSEISRPRRSAGPRPRRARPPAKAATPKS